MQTFSWEAKVSRLSLDQVKATTAEVSVDEDWDHNVSIYTSSIEKAHALLAQPRSH